ncbi:hypothetical protein GGR56DRAFT_661833 [Xylariaceae sp. FL0804]|nr:hypothetical protein GGR56DRAFT_661833 [Xylariaceae sp. FL0804]
MPVCLTANSTAPSGPGLLSTAAAGQAASGPSIFWALAAIVANAMLQPSFCSYIWEGDTTTTSAASSSSEWLVWPHRSLPTVCLLDTAAEVWILVEKYGLPRGWRGDAGPREDAEPREDGEEGDEVEKARPLDIIFRLALFVLGVLPQAIGLFATRGVPGSQVLAAIYLAASLVSMARAADQVGKLSPSPTLPYFVKPPFSLYFPLFYPSSA